MSKHLIVAMHDSFARRYAGHRSLLDPCQLLDGIGSAKLIGAPGYSMEIAVEEQDLAALQGRLQPNFVIEEVRSCLAEEPHAVVIIRETVR